MIMNYGEWIVLQRYTVPYTFRYSESNCVKTGLWGMWDSGQAKQRPLGERTRKSSAAPFQDENNQSHPDRQHNELL